MKRRQTISRQWLIADERMGDDLWTAAQRLPRGSGILLLRRLSPKERRRLRHLANHRALMIVTEAPGVAARVHDIGELRRALLRRTAMILLSPIYPTTTHADWKPLPRMRAAALARLAGRNAVALGGMDEQRYANVAPLGFIAWAGISAFRT
jgi:thiamine-phosphate pyrophosphorylase